MNLNYEQCLAVYDEGSKRIVARAGTGKTTTLREYARQHPHLKIGYFVYGQEMKKSSRRNFPKNVEVHSFHSAAYHQYKKIYGRRITQAFTVETVVESTGLSYMEAGKVWEALSDFFVSGGDLVHHPDPLIEEKARRLWERMKDPKGGALVPLGALLKIASQEGVDLGVDVIVVDEAQDVMPVTAELLRKIDTPYVYVGDDYQGIFGYAGTVSVLDDPTHRLTETYRFGGEILEAVNNFLVDQGAEGDLKSSIGYGEVDAEFEGVEHVLYRTNAALFDSAVLWTERDEKIAIPGLEGDSARGLFGVLLDTYYLSRGDLFKVKSSLIKGMTTFERLKGFSEAVKDPEIKRSVEVVEKYGDTLPERIHLLRNRLRPAKMADKVLMTAHRAKGLEFENVTLADDFSPLYGKDGKRLELDREERNIYYVAMTRASKTLGLNSQLRRALKGGTF